MFSKIKMRAVKMNKAVVKANEAIQKLQIMVSDLLYFSCNKVVRRLNCTVLYNLK